MPLDLDSAVAFLVVVAVVLVLAGNVAARS